MLVSIKFAALRGTGMQSLVVASVVAVAVVAAIAASARLQVRNGSDRGIPVQVESAMPTKLVATDINGSAVSAAVGSTLEIDFVAQPSTGYIWTVIEPSLAFLKLKSSDVLDGNAPSGMVGGKVMQRFNFAVIGAGDGELVIAYRRPWEKTEPKGADLFKMRVVAK